MKPVVSASRVTDHSSVNFRRMNRHYFCRSMGVGAMAEVVQEDSNGATVHWRCQSRHSRFET
jgi:hypothetical protein